MGGLASTRLSRGAWVSGTRILLHINQPVRTNRKIINMNPRDPCGGEFMVPWQLKSRNWPIRSCTNDVIATSDCPHVIGAPRPQSHISSHDIIMCIDTDFFLSHQTLSETRGLFAKPPDFFWDQGTFLHASPARSTTYRGPMEILAHHIEVYCCLQLQPVLYIHILYCIG